MDVRYNFFGYVLKGTELAQFLRLDGATAKKFDCDHQVRSNLREVQVFVLQQLLFPF